MILVFLVFDLTFCSQPHKETKEKGWRRLGKRQVKKTSAGKSLWLEAEYVFGGSSASQQRTRFSSHTITSPKGEH